MQVIERIRIRPVNNFVSCTLDTYRHARYIFQPTAQLSALPRHSPPASLLDHAHGPQPQHCSYCLCPNSHYSPFYCETTASTHHSPHHPYPHSTNYSPSPFLRYFPCSHLYSAVALPSTPHSDLQDSTSTSVYRSLVRAAKGLMPRRLRWRIGGLGSGVLVLVWV